MKGKEKVEQPVLEGEDVQNKVAKEVIKIGNNVVVMGGCFEGPIIINDCSESDRQQLQIFSTASQ
jgi:hypothetical protein